MAGVEYPVFRRRDMRSVSPDAELAVALVTLDPKMPPKIVGSYTFMAQEYPGDIDMFELMTYNGTEDATALLVGRKIQEMALRIQNAPDVFLGDFKGGEDDRFQLPVGKLVKGVLKGYDAQGCREQIKELEAERLLTAGEAEEWRRLTKNYPNWHEWKELVEAMREKVVIRWTLDELLDGIKELPQGGSIDLVDALMQQTMFKVDIWTSLDNRYTEVSNIIQVKTRLPSGKTVNLTVDNTDYLESIIMDIFKYADLKKGKAMKLAKRLWSFLANTKTDDATAEKLAPLFVPALPRSIRCSGRSRQSSACLKRCPSCPRSASSNRSRHSKRRLAPSHFHPRPRPAF